MSIVVLDPDGRTARDCPAWLADAGRDLTLVTGRVVTAAGFARFPGFAGFAEIRTVRRYARSAAVETAVLEVARGRGVSAVVALDPVDQIRAGGLRDHLGLPGQSRDAALVLADAVESLAALARAGVPTVRREEVRRPADLYRWAHRWGYPLVVRGRRGARAVVADLADEAALRVFIRTVMPGDPNVVASLTVEPRAGGERHHGPGLPVTDAALAALPADPGHPCAVAAVREADRWLVHDAGYRPAVRPARELVRAQAGLDPDRTEVA